MKALTKTLLALPFVALLSVSAQAASCSYTTHIASDDKVNSSGNSVGTSISRATVAQILRQDRANLYEIGSSDGSDDADCYFSNKSARAKIPSMLNRGYISQATMREIVTGTPWIRVDIEGSRINVYPAE